MKSSRLLFFAALALLVFVTGLDQSALAAAAKKKPADEPPPDNRKLIQSIDVKASTVVVQYNHDKSTHAYKIDDLTVLKINNQTGKVADIKVGMVVDDYIERDFQNLDSISLSGYGGPLTAVDPKKTAKK